MHTELSALDRDGITVRGPIQPRFEEILTADALRFVAMLHRRYDESRRELLDERDRLQQRLDQGWKPDFSPETASIRDGRWEVAPAPSDLQDRRIEITGPVDRKMIIHALNSGARVFMADFEDATSPTWENVIGGQVHLHDAVRRTIEFVSPKDKSVLRLKDQTATLVVRPRGWHLPEYHIAVDGRPVAGALVDFGLFLFHNGRALLERGSGPYFYLPKLENHREARLWHEVFVRSEHTLGLPPGCVKATVLIETILAAFEMDEILFALREHIVGLNCGRWDYIFSVIKKFRESAEFVLPDRSSITMDRHFLRSYTQLVVKTCHRRGAHAIGGMAAQIPIKADEAANRAALAKVRTDKLREVQDGHDGTWVAHPGLVPVVQQIFDQGMPADNQVSRQREDVHVTATDLLEVPRGTITEAGVRLNVDVGVRYLAAWLQGQGCVPIHNLMEDAATAEISRSQLWQWVHHQALLDDGRPLTPERYAALRDQSLGALTDEVGLTAWSNGTFQAAAELLDQLVLAPAFTSFLTLPAYDRLLRNEGIRP